MYFSVNLSSPIGFLCAYIIPLCIAISIVACSFSSILYVLTVCFTKVIPFSEYRRFFFYVLDDSVRHVDVYISQS